MISIEQTRQTLKSLNLTIIILNAIAAVLILLGIISIGFVLSVADHPEFQAELANQMAAQGLSLDDASIFLGGFAVIFLVLFIIAFIANVVIFILALLNRKKIAANQPSLVVYYLGAIYTGINIAFSLTSLNIISLAIQAGMMSLFVISIQKAKQLKSGAEIELPIVD